METYPLPLQGQCWATPRGALGLWTPAPALLVMVLTGHGDAGFVAPIVRALGRLSGPALQLFVDAGELTNYDSALRTELTENFRQQSERIQYLPVLLGSKIVAMGVTVANLALKGLVTPFSEREAFLAALTQSLRAAKVTAFSLDVLTSLPRAPLTSSRP